MLYPNKSGEREFKDNENFPQRNFYVLKGFSSEYFNPLIKYGSKYLATGEVCGENVYSTAIYQISEGTESFSSQSVDISDEFMLELVSEGLDQRRYLTEFFAFIRSETGIFSNTQFDLISEPLILHLNHSLNLINREIGLPADNFRGFDYYARIGDYVDSPELEADLLLEITPRGFSFSSLLLNLLSARGVPLEIEYFFGQEDIRHKLLSEVKASQSVSDLMPLRKFMYEHFRLYRNQLFFTEYNSMHKGDAPLIAHVEKVILNLAERLRSLPTGYEKFYLNNRIGDLTRGDILLWASIFHDIAKPSFFVHAKNMVTSPEHEGRGAFFIEQYLNTFGFSPLQVDYITEIVALHGDLYQKLKEPGLNTAIEFLIENIDISIELIEHFRADLASMRIAESSDPQDIQRFSAFNAKLEQCLVFIINYYQETGRPELIRKMGER